MKDDLLRGGGLIVLATILFSISDAMAKYVTASVPPVELAAIRYMVFVVMAGLPFLRSRRPSLRTRRPGLQVLRGVGVAGSAILFIIALGTLPIAEATAINFVTPLLVTVLAIPVLGEVVRPQGWAAVLMGFVGMLIVVRPGLGGFHPAAALVLGSSLCWCMATLITRRIAGIDRTEVTLLWTAGTGLVLMLGALPFFLAPLTLGQLGFCVAVGVVATGGAVVRAPCVSLCARHGACPPHLYPADLVLRARAAGVPHHPGPMGVLGGRRHRGQRHLCPAPGAGAGARRGRCSSLGLGRQPQPFAGGGVGILGLGFDLAPGFVPEGEVSAVGAAGFFP